MSMEPGYGERPPTGAFGGDRPSQGSVQDAAREEARTVREHVKSQATEARHKAQARAASSFDQSKGRVAREASGLASALRETADRLEQQQQGNVAVYVRSAANVAERVAGSIEQQDYRGFTRRVDELARREPLYVFAGAAALGFLVSQAIRASRSEGFEGAGEEREFEFTGGGTEGPAY